MDGNPKDKWLMVMPFEAVSTTHSENEQSLIFSLPHPRTNKEAKFLIKERGPFKADLYEINKHKDSFSSWFVDGKFVKSDGSLYISTCFDPLYIILAHLYEDTSDKFVLIDQLFSNCPALNNVGSKLLNCLKERSQMNNISDAAGSDNFEAFRYNEEKTLLWLKKKVERTAAALKDSSMYLAGNEEYEPEDVTAKRYACGMIADFLPSELRHKLFKHLNLSEKNEKRKNSGAKPASKKPKIEALDDYSKLVSSASKANEKKTVSKAQKALSKVDKTGMKSLKSFFTVKPKKVSK